MESAELSFNDEFKIHIHSVLCLFRKKGSDTFINIFLQIAVLFYKRKSKFNIHELRKAGNNRPNAPESLFYVYTSKPFCYNTSLEIHRKWRQRSPPTLSKYLSVEGHPILEDFNLYQHCHKKPKFIILLYKCCLKRFARRRHAHEFSRKAFEILVRF
jgi:hypothetical protein